MEWWQALILGIVEGVTEYLPVSSTGHLILAQRAMGIEQSPAADAYAICIQGGAILAVLGLYFQRVKQMSLGLIGRDAVGLKLGINTVVAFMPAAVIGILISDHIKQYLFGLWPIVFAWFVGGVAILAVAWWKRGHKGQTDQGLDLTQLTWQMALLIGLIQCMAMWPGTSRSLVTIVGGVLVGLKLRDAVEFSFLLGVVTLTAATAKDGLEFHEVLMQEYGLGMMLIGVVAAAVSAAIAVKWMVGYLNKHGLAIFGWYRIGIAVVVATLILLGTLQTHP